MKLNRNRITFSAAGAMVGIVAGGSIALAAGSGSAGREVQPATPTAANLPSAILAAYPMLAKAQTASEESQIPLVIAMLDESSSHGSLAAPEPTAEVDSGLARRYYSSGNTAAYLVPGTKGMVCNVRIAEGHASGASCASAQEVAEAGFVGWRFLGNESVEVHGVLPNGSSAVTIVTTSGSEEVPLNEDGGFAGIPSARPVSLSYTLPNGQVVDKPVLWPHQSTG